MSGHAEQPKTYLVTQTATVQATARPPLLSGQQSDRQRRRSATVTAIMLICTVVTTVLTVLTYLR